jgi:thermitase
MRASNKRSIFLERRSKWINPVNIFLITILLFGVVLIFPMNAFASWVNESGGTKVYTWALVRWETSETVCSFKITHEGSPSPEEIEVGCGIALRVEWESTQTCPEGDPSGCQGLHLAILVVEMLTPTAGLPSMTATPTSTPAAWMPFDWLSIPSSPEELTSTYELAYLSGRLIAYGEVKAADCPDGGLLENGWASECGLQYAYPQALLWQNQFNSAILEAARKDSVPPYLLKNIFVRESQFWPETAHNLYDEYGLGHITTMGADSLLRWNDAFYREFCRSVFFQETCNTHYPLLPLDLQLTLRGAVIQQIMADCAGCAYGINLNLIQASVPIFAQTLNANRVHVERSINILTGVNAAALISPQDLWRFTLTSYNAGPGCFFTALYRTFKSGASLDWEHLSTQFDPGCVGANPYVDFVSNISHFDPSGQILTTYFPPPPPTATPGMAITQEATFNQVVGTPALRPLAETSTPAIETTGEFQPIFSSDQVTDTPVATSDGNAAITPSLDPLPTTPGILTTLPGIETPVLTETPVSATPTPMELTTPSSTQSILTPNNPIDFQSPHVEGELLVKMRAGGDGSIQSILSSLDNGIDAVISAPSTGLDTLVISVDPAAISQVITELRANPNVELAEPNYLARVAYTPNDPFYFQQDYLERIQVPQAWDFSTSLAPVLVAVIDTGVDTAHPDLAGIIWQNLGEIGLDANGVDKRSNGIDDDGNGYLDDWQGWNSVDGNNDVSDGHGHGTHLAGIIAASTNNNEGIAGIAPNARILPVKALDATGYGTYNQIAAAIIYAVDQGAQIINLGFAGEGSSQVLQDAVNYALMHGVVVIAAAGNTGSDMAVFPSAYPGVIAVAAVDKGLFWLPFSTHGDTINLSAPGMDISSTFPGGRYNQMSGTSVASAHVTGVAALLAGLRPDATADELRAILFHTAFDLGSPGWDPYYGFGLVQAYDAMAYASPVAPTPVPTGTPNPGGTGSSAWIAAPIGLWGTTQAVTGCTLTNGTNSTDMVFNGSTAYCSISANGSWTYTAISDTASSTIGAVTLDVRWNTTSWVNDQILIQVSNNNGTSYTTIATYNSTNPPPTTLTTVNYNVSANFITQTQVNNARVRISWTSVSGLDAGLRVYMDEARLNVVSTAQATPTVPARAPTKVPVANDPHVNYFASTGSCAACHRGHTGTGIVLRQAWPEEQVCFTCHTTGGSGTNIQPAFANTNSTTRFFKHDVVATNGVHRVGQTTGTSFGSANRHIECEDCHEPHETTRDATTGTTKAPMIQPVMYFTSGVDPLWTSAGAPFTFTWLPQAQREYQVCFKCHSSYTTLPSYQPDGWGWTGTAWDFISNGLPKLTSTNATQVLDSRDLAQEFNPVNGSYHPVVATGRNTTIPAGAFTTGWSATSMVYCTDCHTNAAATGGTGPHGSSLLHLLAGNGATPYNYITRENITTTTNIQNTGELCFKCHLFTEYATNTTANYTRFRNGTGTNLHEFHSFSSCYACHNTHGSEQLHLINFDSAVVTIPAGYNSQTAWTWDGTTGSCYLTCHGTNHAPEQYTP